MLSNFEMYMIVASVVMLILMLTAWLQYRRDVKRQAEAILADREIMGIQMALLRMWEAKRVHNESTRLEDV